MITPPFASVMTLIALGLSIFGKTIISPILFCIIIIFYCSILSKNTYSAKVFFIYILPFVPPILFMHGILNTNFPVDYVLWNFIPVRYEGLNFSRKMICRVLPIFCCGVLWVNVDRGQVVDWLICKHFPATVIILFSQAASMVVLIKKTIDNTYLALQARGIAVGPGLLKRIRALPKIVIPVISCRLREVEYRSIVLVNRGFGTTKMIAIRYVKLKTTEIMVFITGIMILLGELIF